MKWTTGAQIGDIVKRTHGTPPIEYAYTCGKYTRWLRRPLWQRRVLGNPTGSDEAHVEKFAWRPTVLRNNTVVWLERYAAVYAWRFAGFEGRTWCFVDNMTLADAVLYKVQGKSLLPEKKDPARCWSGSRQVHDVTD